jgi:transposase
MADKVKFKAFPTAFKLAAIKRLEAGEAVLPLARKLGVSRKVLHDWRKAWKLHGPAGLNRKRGPKPGPRKLRPIAELERKVGQQTLDIDFFHKALRALDAADRQGSIAPASRKSSKP